MRKQKNAVIFLSLSMLFNQAFAEVSMSGPRLGAAANDTNSYKSGQVLVKTIGDFHGDELDDLLRSIGGHPIKHFSLVPGLSLIEYDDSLAIEDVIDAFNRSERVEYAEPDYYYRAAVQLDPRFPEQWSFENSGQNGGLVDADINASSMWELSSGNQNVVVGVIDTGINYNHLDLAANLWHNLSEIPANGIDEDQNGYVDDFYGINAINDNGNPFDDNAHGSHVSGIIGAKGNNALGVVGVAQNVQIASCKFLNAIGSGATSDAIQCLQYFANLKRRALNPVNIIATNNSWSGSSKSSALSDAIKAHQNLGILFVAAASNDASDNDSLGTYPANLPLANIISVAATDNKDLLASFSNYGKHTVHIAAPGVKILSTVLNQAYGAFSGTSMATPHVTGLIAIIKSRFPTLDYRMIKNLVIAGGTPLASLQNKTISGRRIRGADVNAVGSLTCVNQIVNQRLTPQANSVSTLGQDIFLSALNINCGSSAGPITLYSDDAQTIILEDNGHNGDVTANDGIYSLLWHPQVAGTFPLNFGNGDTLTVSVLSGPEAPLYHVRDTAFSYETIAGIELKAADESVHTLVAPFPIKFNGNAAGFQTLYVGSNGNISFTDHSNPGYLNRSLPTNTVQSLVAPYWDDLAPTSGVSDIFVATTGVAPNRKLVVEWRNMKQVSASGAATFQTVFFENSADIRFNYLDTDLGNINYNFGKSATIGIQSAGNVVTPYSFNAPNISSSKSLLFRL
jgi:subtilisin family serine protease